MRPRFELGVLVLLGLFGLVRGAFEAPAVLASPDPLGIGSLCASAVMAVVMLVALALEVRRVRRTRSAPPAEKRD